jgi:quaternary ammonium compound-resistance protein SugE
MTRAWTYLVVAGALETVWAVGLKYAQGFTRPVASTVTLVAMGGSMYLLALAVRSLPVGTAYAVWTGIGAVGVAMIGLLFLGEPRNVWRILSIALIVAGIAGLKLSSKT